MMDVSRFYSEKVRDMKPSGIRKFFDIVLTMEDAISLGVGEPDFDTPWQASRAGIQAIEKGYTFYTANAGLLELRQEIAGYFYQRFSVKYAPENEIILTVGGSEALDNVLRAYISNGDEVLIPEPCFVCYAPLVTLAGGRPVPVKTTMADEFKLTPEALSAAITEKSKILLLSYPNNPTGAVMTAGEYEALAPLIRGNDLLVVSDEIYAELTYDGQPVSFAAVPGMFERTIVVSGFSKAFAMTGWRLGYVLAPKELLVPVLKIHQYAVMSAPTIAQFAGLTAMKECLPEIIHMRTEYDLRRKYLLNELRKMGFSCFEPKGAFYMFPSIVHTGLSSEEFCERLLKEQKVAVVPGNAFGESGEGHVRISYSYSMAHLREAMRRIKKFIKPFAG